MRRPVKNDELITVSKENLENALEALSETYRTVYRLINPTPGVENLESTDTAAVAVVPSVLSEEDRTTVANVMGCLHNEAVRANQVRAQNQRAATDAQRAADRATTIRDNLKEARRLLNDLYLKHDPEAEEDDDPDSDFH